MRVCVCESVRQVQCVQYIMRWARLIWATKHRMAKFIYFAKCRKKESILLFHFVVAGGFQYISMAMVAWCSESERHSIVIIEHSTLTLGRAIVNLPRNLHIKKEKSSTAHIWPWQIHAFAVVF